MGFVQSPPEPAMNRFVPLACVLLAAPLAALAQTDCAVVEVHNVRPQQGALMIAAYADEASFDKKPFATMRVPAGEAVTRLRLCGITGPELAVTMYQDLDGNGQMNRNLLGVPSEPWGASGRHNAFGPRWDTARIAFDGSAVIVKLTP
jgi:uncharacterized protein (DUF2141 family)